MDFLNGDIAELAFVPMPEDEAKVTKLNAAVRGSKLTPREETFITDIKQRILEGRKLTAKQDQWLDRILRRCQRQREAAARLAAMN